MSPSSASSLTGRSGLETRVARRRPPAVARRRWLLLFAVAVLAAAAVGANLGPLRQLQDARARLDRTAANVSQLEEQKTALQAELAKLSEVSYLETLAREELTYVRPGEELYIVTGPSVGAVSGSAASRGGVGAGLPGVMPAGGPSEGDQVAGERKPGFLERLLSAIADVF